MSNCNDCNLKFTRYLRIPKILKCNDSVCILCIYKSICNNIPYRCKSHKNIFVKNLKQLEELQTNINLINIIEELEKSKEKPHSNDFADENNEELLNLNTLTIKKNKNNNSYSKCLLNECNEKVYDMDFKGFCSKLCIYKASQNRRDKSNPTNNNQDDSNYYTFGKKANFVSHLRNRSDVLSTISKNSPYIININNNYNDNCFKCIIPNCYNKRIIRNGKEYKFCSEACINLWPNWPEGTPNLK